jgi:3'(2'), 5'-bisphosphate nucleotidase
MPFPVTNVSAIQWMDIQKIVSIAKQAGREVSRRYGKAFPATSGGGPARRLRELLSDILGDTPRDDAGRLEKAAGISLKTILEGLNKMSPSIPVISPDSSNMPFADRANQPYVWLVDPLGIAADAPVEKTSFSVSIALIEGGRPVWGVVYNPLENSIYYAKGASGSYRINADNEPQKLNPEVLADENRHTVFVSGGSTLPEELGNRIDREIGDCRLVPVGRAIGLCLLAEGRASMHVDPGPAMEWETAAGHAIARASGKRVYDYRRGEDLRYNKVDLRNDGFIAE